MFSLLKNKKSSLIGLDIQANEIILTHLRQSKRVLHVEKGAGITLPSGVIVDGKIMDVDCLASIIKTLVTESGAAGCAAAIALSSHLVISRQISLPHACQEEVEAEIYANLNQYFPGVTDEVYLDYFVHGKDMHAQHALLIAAKKDVVDAYIEAVNRSGLTVKVVEVDWCALLRALGWVVELKDKTLCVLDVSEEGVHLQIFQNLSRIFTQKICLSLYAEDFLKKLGEFVGQAFQKCNAVFRDINIEKLYLIGQALSSRDLQGYLGGLSGCQIEYPNLLSQLQVSSNVNSLDFSRLSPRSWVSVGLALRSCPQW